MCSGFGFNWSPACERFKEKGIANLIGVDPRKDRQEQAKKETQIDSVSDDFRMVLKDQNIDTVFVTLQTAYHTSVIEEAVNHNCDLFVEKPIAASSDGLDIIHKSINEGV